jgi:hypothetical protein
MYAYQSSLRSYPSIRKVMTQKYPKGSNEENIRHVENNLIDALKVRQPYPHIFSDNFLSERHRSVLRDSFATEKFSTAPGGCPVSNIAEHSTPALRLFRYNFIESYLIPRLDDIFSEDVEIKYNELSQEYKYVSKLARPEMGFLHLTRNHKGTTINSHRDDDRATYQLVIYLGDDQDEPVETTELIWVDTIEELERTSDYSRLQLLSYGSTRNGILVFANQPNSYQCLSKPAKSERWTISGSVIHYKVSGPKRTTDQEA